jgi:hypothetical protein
MTEGTPGHVGTLEFCDFLRVQSDLERGHRIIEMLEAGRADDRRGNARLLQHPGKRHLSHRDAASFGDPLDRFDDLLI